MVLEVSAGAVTVVSAETNGGGPMGHHVSSGPVSRFSGTRKTIIRDKFCENLKVPLKISTQTSGFPKLAPERSWGIAGMAGRAETHPNTRPRARAPRGQLPFLGCMMLSWQSTANGNLRNFKFREIFLFFPVVLPQSGN